MNWKLIEDKSWCSLEQQFEWVREMNTVQQDIRYHAEGSVAEHTRMVLEALQQSSAYHSLSTLEKELIWTSALLHDVEKRSTSVDEGEGRVSAKGHARKGEYTVRTILYRDCPAPFHIREQIASLVRYHGLPVWLMEKPDSVKKLCEASLRVDTSLLKMLADADIRGRICEDKNELLEALELFEIFCREQDCWKKPREFATDYARFHYFHTEDSYIDYVPHEQFKCEVTMLSGLPGMGKDYYIQSAGIDVPVVSLDVIRRKHKLSPTDKSANGWVVQTAKEEARTYLRKGQEFVWNATNITRQMRVVTRGEEVCYLYYLESGIVRLWFPDKENREISARFIQAKEFINFFLSHEEHHAHYNIKALEPCKIWRLPKKDLHQLYELSINFNKLARIHLVRSINRKIIREEEFYTLDAEARYKALLANEKWLLRSIPLKDIASYIGITPQALSNIRKRI